MPSCCRHVAPPSVTFLQEGGEGGHPRTLPSFRCHPGAPFCAITARASASTILYFYSFLEKKIRKKAVEKTTNNTALRRDYRHQKMNALLGRRNVSVVTLGLSFPFRGCPGARVSLKSCQCLCVSICKVPLGTLVRITNNASIHSKTLMIE